MPKLVVITKGLAALSQELGESWVTIGRSEGNTFQISEASVSGQHGEVRLQGEDLLIRDLQSTNGTFVDDKKITEGILKPGQTLRLGEVELRLEPSVPTEAQGAAFMSKMLLTASPAKTASPPPANPAPVLDVKQDSSVEAGDAAGKKYQVLLVDDSMAFLETFSQMCSVLSNRSWTIHCAASADQALAMLQKEPMDMVVLDLGIPMVDGIQLLGIISRRYPGLKIAVLTGKPTEENRAVCLAGGAELFIEKPVSPEGIKAVYNMLNDLVSWTHSEGFSGTLRKVGLPEVIQIECNSRHSSILEVRNQQLFGQIYIEAGVITHATADALTGDQAFNRLLSLAGGEFQLKPFKAPPQRTVHCNWEVLLLEAARRTDEETVLLARPAARKVPDQPASNIAPPAPPPALREKPASEVPAPGLDSEHALLGDGIVVVATYDGEWKPTDEPKK